MARCSTRIGPAFAWLLVTAGSAGAPGCGVETTPVPSVEAAPQAALVEPEEQLTRNRGEVRRGEPLDLVLRRLGVEPEERLRVARTLGSEIDVRRILPGEGVEVARDGEGHLREAVLIRGKLRRVVARFEPGREPTVETIEREPERFLRSLRGTIDGSLYESLIALGGDADLVMRFADLLAWEVDFLTETRPGDRFRILVERERIDEEPLGFGRIWAAEYSGARASGRAVRWVDSEGSLDWYDDTGHSVRRAFLKSPLEYRRISSGFTARRRHPVLKKVLPHWGVDYAAPQGTPVSALGDGVVRFAGRKGGFGNYLEIRHNSTYTTCYGHLWKFARGVRRGARVSQGQVVGYVGSTGLSTGPHLDFRVKRNGAFVNPLRLKSPPGRRVASVERVAFEQHRDRAWRLVDRIASGETVAEAAAWNRVPPGETKGEMLALVP